MLLNHRPHGVRCYSLNHRPHRVGCYLTTGHTGRDTTPNEQQVTASNEQLHLFYLSNFVLTSSQNEWVKGQEVVNRVLQFDTVVRELTSCSAGYGCGLCVWPLEGVG